MIFNYFNLINDDAFVSAATADACFMVPRVCLFMKTHLLALLQDNCIDLVCCAFMHKLSVFCQHLLSAVSAWPIYRSISSACK